MTLDRTAIRTCSIFYKSWNTEILTNLVVMSCVIMTIVAMIMVMSFVIMVMFVFVVIMIVFMPVMVMSFMVFVIMISVVMSMSFMVFSMIMSFMVFVWSWAKNFLLSTKYRAEIWKNRYLIKASKLKSRVRKFKITYKYNIHTCFELSPYDF